jgi:hypothetical protein
MSADPDSNFFLEQQASLNPQREKLSIFLSSKILLNNRFERQNKFYVWGDSLHRYRYIDEEN